MQIYSPPALTRSLDKHSGIRARVTYYLLFYASDAPRHFAWSAAIKSASMLQTRRTVMAGPSGISIPRKAQHKLTPFAVSSAKKWPLWDSQSQHYSMITPAYDYSCAGLFICTQHKVSCSPLRRKVWTCTAEPQAMATKSLFLYASSYQAALCRLAV